ncbi:MAG: cytochrome C oxidase subunit IV family protein [Rhodothermales bacterium]|nr:cytochrome C oxidase subunit IV family protein [Rhodothermales bacterium]
MAHSEHHGHHIIPKRLLYRVFGALVALTIFTVLTAQVDLGILNVPLALAIALTKASLVLTFFMALKWDNRVNTLVVSIGSLFVVVFLVFTLFDTAFRGDLDNVDDATIQDQLRIEEALQAREPENLPPSAPGAAGGTAAAPADTTAAAPADTTGTE